MAAPENWRCCGTASARQWREVVWAGADGVIAPVPDQADLPRAVKLALALKRPLQDCLYLALAERLGATLGAAGDKFAAKTLPAAT